MQPGTQKLLRVTSMQVIKSIRVVVQCLGKEDALGYSTNKVGTHSLWSAMAMYLAGIPVYTIMLIGRWSSDAFLRCIWHQVQEFSSGVSSRVILNADYFTIPDFLGTEDPYTSGHHLNFVSHNQVGQVAQTVTGRTNMSFWH